MLVGTCMGLFVLMLDSTVVALALPTIEKELHASADNVQWVLNGYLLVLSVLVVTAGRLGDIYGRRLVFLIGMAVFAAGSVLAAVASDDAVLVAARAVQGAGGAAMLSLSLAIVSHAFPEEQQGQALGIWAAVSALALAIGPLVGGLLIDVDWRLIFWINLPICAFGIAITWWSAHESRDETSPPKLDLRGLATLTPGLLAFVFALVRADDWGWGSARTIGVLAVGILFLAAFWAIEHRVESADRRLQPLPQRALPGRLGRGLHPGRRLLGGDLLPAAVPAGRSRPRPRRRGAADPAGDRADGLHLAVLRTG